MSKRIQQPFQRLQRNPETHGSEPSVGTQDRPTRHAATELEPSTGGECYHGNAEFLASLHIGLMRLSESLGRMGRDDS